MKPAALLAALALALGAAPGRGRAEEPPPVDLRLDLPTSLTVTGLAVAGILTTELGKETLAPPTCRWCTPGAVDERVRSALRWSNTDRAGLYSDLLIVGVPLFAAGSLALAGHGAGGTQVAVQDFVIAAEAVSVAVFATQVVKFSVGRLRPYAWADPSSIQGRDANLSFWSGHTSTTFAAATAAGTVARLRGYRSWPWILGIGLAGAATCGYLRIAADRHWASDVLAGAAMGSLIGVGLPVLFHGRKEPVVGSVRLQVVTPFAIAGTF